MNPEWSTIVNDKQIRIQTSTRDYKIQRPPLKRYALPNWKIKVMPQIDLDLENYTPEYCTGTAGRLLSEFNINLSEP